MNIFFCVGEDFRLVAFRFKCIENFRSNMLMVNAKEVEGLLVRHLFHYGKAMSSRLQDKLSTTEKQLDQYDKEMVDNNSSNDGDSYEL